MLCVSVERASPVQIERILGARAAYRVCNLDLCNPGVLLLCKYVFAWIRYSTSLLDAK
jgi:hypothetical protein